MIDELNNKINKLNKKMGVEVKLPETSKSKLTRYSLINLVAGASLLALGVITETKGTLVLGGMAIASSILMKSEAKRK
ncbi:hypothetical protein I6N95_19320 [Vagococcus sp. BWB3-3]|uniref:Uncharacterized protein n=1 Tax=Vagococcus allomyrinae TaxID=2794353 RepID=A0A940PFU8_9ENTE|nr:hypothetical protein [Vagococcus allomyrinae]MBP1043173.1 hypothetical protein [Vagococcus allomyrinae]